MHASCGLRKRALQIALFRSAGRPERELPCGFVSITMISGFFFFKFR